MLAIACLLSVSVAVDFADVPEFTKDARDRAVAATVRVTNLTRNIGGSGVLLQRNGPVVYVLTANHVVDGAKRLEILTFASGSPARAATAYHTAEVIAQSPEVDLAIVRFSTSDQMPGAAAICPPSRLPEEKGFAALSVGCAGGDPPTSVLEDVQAKRRVRRRDAPNIALYWETDRAPEEGRSGGPLLDRGGYLIGIDSGANEGKGYYIHAEEIHAFLRRHGLKWLFEEKARK